MSVEVGIWISFILAQMTKKSFRLDFFFFRRSKAVLILFFYRLLKTNFLHLKNKIHCLIRSRKGLGSCAISGLKTREGIDERQRAENPRAFSHLIYLNCCSRCSAFCSSSPVTLSSREISLVILSFRPSTNIFISPELAPPIYKRSNSLSSLIGLYTALTSLFDTFSQGLSGLVFNNSWRPRPLNITEYFPSWANKSDH